MALRETILTVLAHRKRTGYEIAQDFDKVMSYMWSASHQQIYRELARLHSDGCVVFTVIPQKGKPDKKVYGISKLGRAELKRWVASPTPVPRTQNEFLVKLLAGTLVDKPALRREVARVRERVHGLLDYLHKTEKICGSQLTNSDYDQSIFLALRHWILMVEAQAAWLQEVTAHLKE
jgi:PadR family transcriptional regulator, regulatory protein AphA